MKKERKNIKKKHVPPVLLLLLALQVLFLLLDPGKVWEFHEKLINLLFVKITSCRSQATHFAVVLARFVSCCHRS